MRDLVRSEAAIALPSLSAAQSVPTMAAFAVPVAAPAAAADIAIPAIYVGGYAVPFHVLAALCATAVLRLLITRESP